MGGDVHLRWMVLQTERELQLACAERSARLGSSPVRRRRPLSEWLQIRIGGRRQTTAPVGGRRTA